MSVAATDVAATPVRKPPAVPSGVLGMLIFVCTELMFFLGLISAFMIIKAGAIGWPPPGQPRLPAGATAVTTLFLLASGVVLFKANRAFVEDPADLRALTLTRRAALLGTIFVAVQGYEWSRLLGFGLTMQSSPYGSFFYLIVGTHALHALAAIAALGHAAVLLARGTLSAPHFWTVQAFWYFVVGIWPVLYWLVYLG